MKKHPIYLDHNATTQPRPEVREAMLYYMGKYYGNPSSLYSLGQESRKALDVARKQIAHLLGVKDPEEIIFTSGGSESINLAIKGVAFAHPEKKHLVTSAIEHSAALNGCRYLEKIHGYAVTYLSVDQYGQVNPAEVEGAIRADTALVTLMHANNELGTIQKISEIGLICRNKGTLFHVDAVQTVGKIPVHVDELYVDLLSLSGHKFYGPKGIGALYVRPGTRMVSLIHGGRHEKSRRAGTENVAGAVGLGVACDLARKEMAKEMKHVGHLRERLEKELLESIPCARLNGHPKERLFSTLNISFEFVEAEGLIISLDLQGVMVSSGSACSSGSVEASHVLKAIGLTPELAKGSLRFSLGRENTEKDIEETLKMVPEMVARLRNISPLWGDYQQGLRKSVIVDG